MKILVVKMSSMGDIFHTLPALTDAMCIIPSIRFDWVVEEDFAQIPTWHPAVDRIIPVALRRWRKHWFCSHSSKERLHFKHALRLRKYDAIIDAQGLMKSSILVTRLTKGIKHGLNSRSARESLSSWWYDKRYEIHQKQHAIERIRELFSKVLDYEKPKMQGDYAISSYFLSNFSSNLIKDAGRYLVFLHSTTKKNKYWPESHWHNLIKFLIPTGLRIKLPWGVEHELQQARRIASSFNHIDILPKLTLEKIALVLIGAKAVVSVDSGLSHLTAALGRPNITLYGPTDPNLIGIQGLNQYTLSAPKIGKMSSISAVQVNNLLQFLISQTGSRKQKNDL